MTGRLEDSPAGVDGSRHFHSDLSYTLRRSRPGRGTAHLPSSRESRTMSTSPRSCELLVDDLRLSNLIDRRQLAEVVEEFFQRHPNADPHGLALFLVKQGILTEFQAENLRKGRMQNMVVGPYTLTDSLGAGSMGTVYKARSKNDDHWYAVKVLPRRDMWNLRLVRRQIRALEECPHPGLVPFVDVGTSGGTHYL